MVSPYENVDVVDWLGVTRDLIAEHPLSLAEIREFSTKAWRSLWSTTIGVGDDSVPIADLALPATVVGYFFERLFSKLLEEQYPGQWRGGGGGEKDLIYIADPKYSVEMKMSGQVGLKIFGNRSYGQELQTGNPGKKEKSGYYLTFNFHAQKLFFIRFGWIEASDWKAQLAATGQMAGLGQQVYDTKLIPVTGDFCLDAPIQLLNGVGSRAALNLREQNIISIRDALNRGGLALNNPKLHNSATAFRDAYGNQN